MKGVDIDAQDRLPPIPAEKLTEAQKKAAAEFLAERKQPVFGPFVPLSRSPGLMLARGAAGKPSSVRQLAAARCQ